MSFSFDLEAAIDAITTLEAAISTPSPGIVTAYGFGSNPAEITDNSLLPAIVHIPLGPATGEGAGEAGGRFTFAHSILTYDIASIALISEAVPDIYPSDESAASLFWLSICNVFFDKTNILSLKVSAVATSYTCLFYERSYQPRQWPPPPVEPLRWYWSYRYIHRFKFLGA